MQTGTTVCIDPYIYICTSKRYIRSFMIPTLYNEYLPTIGTKGGYPALLPHRMKPSQRFASAT